MNAAAGLSRQISQVIPPVMIFVTTKSLTCSRIISLMSPSFSSSVCQRPPTPWMRELREDLDALLDGGHGLLADLLDHPVADVVQVRPKSDASSLTMPCRSNLSGSSTPASASSPNSQLIRPLRRWSRMLSLNLRMPPFTPAMRLPRNPTGCLDDLAEDARRAGEHAREHRDELADGVDDRLDRTDGLVDQALVVRLQCLDPLVETLARLDVLRREGVDHRLLLCVDVVLHPL